jgi:Ca-activated chloride channel homolog
MAKRFTPAPFLLIAVLSGFLLTLTGVPVSAQDTSCTDDAMIVFDSSGSMSGMLHSGVRESRIERVRRALEIVLPQVERHRKIGLIVYGPQIGSPHNSQSLCSNIDLRLTPQPLAARQIIAEVRALVPAGVTPLTQAILLAARQLNYKEKPSTIVLFTDGQETCGGTPCASVRQLLLEAAGLRIHVINYAVPGPFGTLKPFGAACIAEQTGGLYVPVETLEELVEAFRMVLGCPLVTDIGR